MKREGALFIPSTLYFILLRHLVEYNVGVSLKCIRQMGPCRDL